ncbi:MAG: hypothetical protein ACQESE_01580 [Nanobdellota archaeon]
MHSTRNPDIINIDYFVLEPKTIYNEKPHPVYVCAVSTNGNADIDNYRRGLRGLGPAELSRSDTPEELGVQMHFLKQYLSGKGAADECSPVKAVPEFSNEVPVGYDVNLTRRIRNDKEVNRFVQSLLDLGF